MTSAQEFRVFGKAMIDYIADYLESIKERNVLPKVKPGYISPLLPDEAPEEPEHWQEVMKDIERVIMPGITHWHHPRFFAYFPMGNSYPAIVADILTNGIGCMGFSWIASPACTELEMVMMDWLGKMLKLPEEFLFSGKGNGGGVIQGSASETTLLALLSARSKAITTYSAGLNLENLDEGQIMHKLIAYASKQSHSSAERAGLLGGVKMRLLDTDEDFTLRGSTVEAAIAEDQSKGLIPFCVIATLGTTSCCSFDNILEIGPVCRKNNIWLHIDAAYAGSSFICPEYRPLLNGVEHADSFNFNPHKWMLVNFDCSAMWVKDQGSIVNAFNVDPLYLKHDHQGSITDYRHWNISLGRRFRSLKLWFVLRLYGQNQLREYIRNHVRLAHEFASLVEEDDRFELTNRVTLGLVCFRLKGPNQWSELLNKKLNEEGKMHLTPSKIGSTYFLRLAICYKKADMDDITFAWNEVSKKATEVINHVGNN